MIIRKYIVKDMNEAMAKIRFELGKDAIIISQNKVRQPGVLGVFKPKLIEVTAALENLNTSSKRDIEEEKEFQESINSIKKLMEYQVEESKKEENIAEKDNKKEEFIVGKENNIHKEVIEMKAMLNEVIKNTIGLSNDNEEVSYLKSIDIREEYMEGLMLKSKIKKIDFKESIKEILTEELMVSNKELLGRVVLVGPTGVGKTTTIAKFAGKLSLEQKKKVGLITIDTYRIGAVEQLRTYAKILNIPFKVVISIKDMEEAIKELSYCDVVLIDTTGRSSKNKTQLLELREFIKKANPDRTSLVISSVTKNKDLQVILDGYSDLDYEDIIITKLDETSVYGSIYNIVKMSNRPISYVTTGQNVPNDIKPADKKDLVSIISEEEYLC